VQTASRLPRQALLRAYRTMRSIRAFEERVLVALVDDQAFDTLDAPIKRVPPPHGPPPFSPALEDLFVPGPARIEQAVRETPAWRR
jgi:pyruvate/2-oxoglutarate/acetoin dehydrogenase E1 component